MDGLLRWAAGAMDGLPSWAAGWAPRPSLDRSQRIKSKAASGEGIEQEQNFVVYLPSSVQVPEPSAVLASLPRFLAIPYLNSL